jgi:hypothetical protein
MSTVVVRIEKSPLMTDLVAHGLVFFRHETAQVLGAWHEFG